MGFKRWKMGAIVFIFAYFIARESGLGCLKVGNMSRSTKRRKPAESLGIGPKLYNVTRCAGTWRLGFEDGKARSASFALPYGITIGPDGTIYVSDMIDNRIRQISPDLSTVTTLAGNGDIEDIYVDNEDILENFYITGHDCDVDGMAVEARFNKPHGLAVTSQGRVLVADTGNHKIRQIGKKGLLGLRTVRIFAGFTKYGIPAHPNQTEALAYPMSVAVDTDDNVYVADTFCCKIRKYSPSGEELAHWGKTAKNEEIYEQAILGELPGQDGVIARTPEQAILDAKDDNPLSKIKHSYIIERAFNISTPKPSSEPSPLPYLHQIFEKSDKKDKVKIEKKDDSTPIRFVPTEFFQGRKEGYFFQSGSLGLGYYLDSSAYSSSQKQRENKKNSETLALIEQFGKGSTFFPTKDQEDEGLDSDAIAEREANEAIAKFERTGQLPQISSSEEIPFDARYEENRRRHDPLQILPDVNRLNSRQGLKQQIKSLHKIDLPKEIHKDGLVNSAKFKHPRGIVVDKSGTVYITDPPSQSSKFGHWIRKISPEGNVTTMGAGPIGHRDGRISNALFYMPTGLAIDPNGDLFVTESLGCRVRRITPFGDVSTIAGTAPVVDKEKRTVDGEPVPFYRAYRLDDNIEGPESEGWPRGKAVDGLGHIARFQHPLGIAAGPDGSLYVCDSCNHQIRKLTPVV